MASSSANNHASPRVLLGPSRQESSCPGCDTPMRDNYEQNQRPQWGLGAPFPHTRSRTEERLKPQWGLGETFPRKKRRLENTCACQCAAPQLLREASMSGCPLPELVGNRHVGQLPPVHPRPSFDSTSQIAHTDQSDHNRGPGGSRPVSDVWSGHSTFLEHFAEGLEDVQARNSRNGSDQTLTEDKAEKSRGGEDSKDDSYVPNWWFGVRRKIREPLAEWLGTMVNVLIGTAGNLQYRTSSQTAGDFTQSALVYGLGAMMSIYIAGGISGAHCNPMVSIALSVFRGFPARKAFIYIFAQIIGAICGMFIAYGIYREAIINFDPQETTATGQAFYALPLTFASTTTAFFSDFLSAAMLGGTILAIGDDSNCPPGAGMNALIIGLVVFVQVSTFGYIAGCPNNPARDLASRLVPYWVGYGDTMWERGWWAEVWGACIAGALTGCLVYDVAIFEGEESPVNYSAAKWRKGAKRAKSEQKVWWMTGLCGRRRRERVKVDLEEGKVGFWKREERWRMDGH